jgi:hypothetical protein
MLSDFWLRSRKNFARALIFDMFHQHSWAAAAKKWLVKNEFVAFRLIDFVSVAERE